MNSITEDKNIRLEASYNEVPVIKKLGAMPYYKDGSFVCWYVPKGKDLAPFKKWWSGKYLHEYNLKNGLAHSLSDYLKFVSSMINDQFKFSEWIVCNISDITVRNYASIEISDYDEGGSETAKARAVLYGKKLSLLDKFRQATGMPLSPGHKVMIKIQPSFNEKYGMSYSIDDIKPEFTIGDMEAKLNKIREALVSQGLYDKNKKLISKPYPSRVAVISPENAAGLGDFMTISNILHDNELCDFSYYSAYFQGDKVTTSFELAVKNLLLSHQEKPYDLVCLIRGGGDKAGLNHLNNLEIAKMIANIGIPVVTGIGHEKDFTILDEICHTRMPTPSLCVSYVKDLIFKDLEHTQRLISDTINVFDGICERESILIDNSLVQFDSLITNALNSEINSLGMISNEISSALDISLANERNEIEALTNSFDRTLSEVINNESRDIKEIFNFIMANNPLAVLERGYTVISKEGDVIKSSTDLVTGNFSITFKDKKINAKIEV